MLFILCNINWLLCSSLSFRRRNMKDEHAKVKHFKKICCCRRRQRREEKVFQAKASHYNCYETFSSSLSRTSHNNSFHFSFFSFRSYCTFVARHQFLDYLFMTPARFKCKYLETPLFAMSGVMQSMRGAWRWERWWRKQQRIYQVMSQRRRACRRRKI